SKGIYSVCGCFIKKMQGKIQIHFLSSIFILALLYSFLNTNARLLFSKAVIFCTKNNNYKREKAQQELRFFHAVFCIGRGDCHFISMKAGT
ncbi:MAG TPA: hypothetical protein PLD98_08765, partial [Clostridiales bacterium]|nr:hypothetical protein [Clostridiales bacterium]